MTSQLAAFIEKLKTDAALRQKIAEAEAEMAPRSAELLKQIADTYSANADHIIAVAEQYGFDLSEELGRAGSSQFRPAAGGIENLDCVTTCCYVATSTWRNPVHQM